MSAFEIKTGEYSQRMTRARELMEQKELDALLLFTGPNLVYFTGVPCGRSGSRPFLFILPKRGNPVLIVHDGRQFEARRLGIVDDVRTYTYLSHLPLETTLKALADLDLLGAQIGAELGGEMVLDLPFSELTNLQNALPGAEFVDASQLLWQMRMVKSPAEAACVTGACKITLEAYERTFKSIRQGMTEAEIESAMMQNMLKLGGFAPWVLITSGSGNYDLVSKGGSQRRVQPGDMVWMDSGCSVEGYFSDFGRAGVLGGPSKAQEDAQRKIHEITYMGVEMLRPGIPVAEIATCCNEAVRNFGIPITSNISKLAARVGHGLGRTPTELPSLSEDDPTILLEGMIMTVEPGVATEFGTFHIEENVLITQDGPQLLTDGHWQLWTI
jgi:Xaa-Pro dipeptidase